MQSSIDIDIDSSWYIKTYMRATMHHTQPRRNTLGSRGLPRLFGRLPSPPPPLSSLLPRASPKERGTQFDRDEHTPPENIHHAAEEINKDAQTVGNREVDPFPLGGKGQEPPPADGEGVGYNMLTDVAQKSSSSESSSSESSSSSDEGEGTGFTKEEEKPLTGGKGVGEGTNASDLE